MKTDKAPLTQKEFAAQGGKARAKKLTQEERSEIARVGGKARWAKKGKGKGKGK